MKWMSENNFAYFWSKLKARLSTANTTAYWRAHPSYLPTAGEMIIYTDMKVEGGVTYAGIKIGDGNAYVADLPFVGQLTENELHGHVSNTTVHTSAAEKAKWDAKLNCELDGETLIFNRE